jgi:dinuclear metal center YbgI/SA1388 family protein
MAALEKIVRFSDRLLKTAEFTDWPGAINGLQVQNSGQVHRIAALVDATLATVKLAVAAKADLMVVHHGLFWSETHPWTGKKYELLALLLRHDMAVYSSHLPLDAHPRIGNNAQICDALGFKVRAPFYFEKGRHLGFQVQKKMALQDLVSAVERAIGPVRLLPGGPSACKKIGVVSGGAGQGMKIARDEGVDTFITGEGPHWTYAMAEEMGLNVLYAGHYATETFGVKALGALLSGKFRIPWSFIDHPTGL